MFKNVFSLHDMKKNDLSKFAARLVLPLLLLGAGCHRNDVQVYTVSSDQTQPQPPLAAMPPTNAVDTASLPSQLPPGHPDISSMQGNGLPQASTDQSAVPLTWTTPDGWTSVPPSEMRVASFNVTNANGKTADVSIVPLSGMGGGDAPNVNRWRGQVGLAPTTDDQIQSSAENVEAAGQPAVLYDLGGATTRILGVIQHRDDNNSWFYKMTGDPGLVEQQKPVFIAFLKSLSFTTSQAQAQLPPGHPDIGGMDNSAGPISHEGQPNWQVPAGWTEVSGGQFLIAKFTIAGDNSANAAVNVSSATGVGGGLSANVNRWRGQLGMQPIDSPSTTSLTINGGAAQIVDLTGTDARTGKPSEILAVIVTEPNATWSYKLMGDPKIVAAQKDAFTKFVQGVKY